MWLSPAQALRLGQDDTDACEAISVCAKDRPFLLIVAEVLSLRDARERLRPINSAALGVVQVEVLV